MAAAQFQRYDRYDRFDRRQVREVIARLENTTARLESDLNRGRDRRVLGGLFWVRTDSAAVTELREFRRTVNQLRRNTRGNFAFENSRDEAWRVIERGFQLDRNLRLRTGRTDVDAELANLRSNLHLLAEVYGINVRY
jgi:hypothetical protein